MKNEFETQINRFISTINEKKLGFGWQNHANRLHNGKYIDGEPFDFTIILKNGKTLVFDAKEIHSKTWKILPKDIKQCNNMLRCVQNKYCKAFFIVYFHEYKEYRIIFAVDAAIIIHNNRKTIKFEEMEAIKLESLI